MDSTDSSWLKEMGLDDSIFMDEQVASVLGNCSSAPNPSEDCYMGSESPDKLQKSNFLTIQTVPNSDRTPIILNFGNTVDGINPLQVVNPDEEAAVSEFLRTDSEEKLKPGPTQKRTSRVRPPLQTYHHNISERKRREQLSQSFLTLSTIVPGLKKMDKTSVLGDAINYLRHLQERVTTLEEEERKQPMESVVLVKKSQIIAEAAEGFSDDEQPLPEIEARLCNNHILLRVRCQKRKGIFVNILRKVEKVGLSVVNTNVTPLGRLDLDITIVAEMGKDFNLTVKEVVKNFAQLFRGCIN